MTLTTEQAEAASGATAEPKPAKKPNVGKRARHVASTPAKSGKKTSPARKADTGGTKAKVRAGTKTAKILNLLKRPGGATAKELMKATGWQPHSVRGFLSGTVAKRMRMTVTSTKGEDGERRYSVK
jgi:hypothetical protein